MPSGIGLVVDDIEAGLLEDRPAGVGKLDAERVGDIDDRDLVADLALLLQLLQHVGGGGCEGRGRALDEEQRRIALGQCVDLIGHGRLGDLRIAVLGEDRCGRKVIAGAVNRHDEVDLVGREPLDRLDGFAGLAAVVVLDQLDLLLPALELEPALGVDLVLPELEVRKMGDRGATRHHAGARPDHSDFDGGVLGPGDPKAEWSSQSRGASNFEYGSSMHFALPENVTILLG